jgi:predicted lipoprotein with Yx(FWY)xxD motif
MSPAAPSSPPAPASPSAKPVLETAKAGNLGTIVTDSNGFTLYRFDHDSSNPSKATCTGSCATLWPPVAATGNVQVQGINQSLVSTVTRPDGTTQLTLNGWPLYRYAPDQKPGDTKGEGFMGIWFAATPTGGRAMAASSPSTGGSGGGGGGY